MPVMARHDRYEEDQERRRPSKNSRSSVDDHDRQRDGRRKVERPAIEEKSSRVRHSGGGGRGDRG